MSQANTATIANTAAAADSSVGRWAREAARAAAGAPRAGNRFYSMAVCLIGAAKPGETVRVTFAEVNAATGKKRGEGAANPRAAWVRALSAIAELHGAEVVAGRLELRDVGVSVGIADDNRAFVVTAAK